MRKIITILMTLVLLMTSAVSALVICYADEEDIATKAETTERTEVGEPGMVEVSGKDVKDGEYDIKVDSDSGMFNIVSTKLTVKDGKMTCVMTLHGDGYKEVYPGTPEQAVKAENRPGEAKVVDGDYTYEFPVPSLNTKVNVSALSEKYNKWYGHQLVFRADSLPEGSVKIDLNRNKLDKKDGEYTIEVELSGGTGRATITSPAKITVKDGIGTASIEWSSPNYDYMIVGGEKFLPQNKGEGNSLFEIPVLRYDEPMKVIADTTAMSTPHEIEYELTFKRDSVKGGSALPVPLVAGLAAAIVIIAALLVHRKK